MKDMFGEEILIGDINANAMVNGSSPTMKIYEVIGYKKNDRQEVVGLRVNCLASSLGVIKNLATIHKTTDCLILPPGYEVVKQ